MDYSHDRNYKHLLSYRKIFQEVIEHYIEGEWKQELDLEKAEKMDKSFILQDFAERESDIIYRVLLNKKRKKSICTSLSNTNLV
ncbi:MAG: Rpn family recombination-promoting nuclease/putative transposase [Candidatus Brocadiae bacterium]|nr:Rpn family recombination-promoting nuclease/putative transposase [Candidatus Brocadiia bacterium]